MSADTNNCDFENVEYQRLLPSCEISSRSPMDLSDVSKQSFCLQQSAFVFKDLIQTRKKKKRSHAVWLTVTWQRFQIVRIANFPTSLSFSMCVTIGRESSVRSACSALYCACF